MAFEKGNKMGNRFTADKQPAKKRGKGKLTSIAAQLSKIAGEKIKMKDGKNVLIAEALARQIVRMAMNGNTKAMAMVIDRLDGKVPDTINHNIEGELKGAAPSTTVQIILSEDTES
jgi:hypothetical protein